MARRSTTVQQAPIAAGSEWAPGQRSIRTPIPLGLREDGTVATLAVWDKVGGKNIFLCGAIGSGKTNALNVVMAGLMASRDTVVWVIDVAKRGKSLAPWLPCIDWLVTDPADAVTMLTAVNRVIDARALIGARLAAEGKGDAVMQPSPRLPLLVVLIDEASALMGRTTTEAMEATEQATQVAETDRETAVGMVISTQKPTQDSLGGSGRLKAQLNPTLALRMNRLSDLRWALQNARPEDLNLSAFTVPGVLLAQDGDDTSPLPVRSYALYDPPVVAALARRYAAHRPALDAVSANAAGAAYTGRNRDPLGLRTPTTHHDKATTVPTTEPSRPVASAPTRESIAAAKAQAMSLLDEAAAAPLPRKPLADITDAQPPTADPVDPAAITAALTALTAAPDGMTRAQVQAATGIGKTTACRVLGSLMASGKVTRRRDGQAPTYHTGNAA